MANGTSASLIDVCVEYPDADGTVHALRHVSHEFAAGHSTAIIGRSGSGKSTLVNVLGLLRTPTSGQVLIDGESTAELSDAERSRIRSKVGMVFQNFHVDQRSTVLRNVMLPWYWRDNDTRTQAQTYALEALDRLGIGDIAARRPSQISGGQRQRVAIARALCFNPTILIADEPTGNLDETTANEVIDDLFRVCRGTATTLVVVTHDRAVAERAEEVLTVRDGWVDREQRS